MARRVRVLRFLQDRRPRYSRLFLLPSSTLPSSYSHPPTINPTALNPPTYTLHTLSPIPSHFSIMPDYASLITPSARHNRLYTSERAAALIELPLDLCSDSRACGEGDKAEKDKQGE